MHMELQVVDVNTCLPIPELLADVWHCNSTGFYSGIAVEEAQGGLNTTFLRGIQSSDSEGITAFDTLFPGHYDGRITHFHLVVRTDATLQENNTYTGGTTLHIGQVYFDDTLMNAVEATYPYNTNPIEYTSWEVDVSARWQKRGRFRLVPAAVSSLTIPNSTSIRRLSFRNGT